MSVQFLVDSDGAGSGDFPEIMYPVNHGPAVTVPAFSPGESDRNAVFVFQIADPAAEAIEVKIPLGYLRPGDQSVKDLGGTGFWFG
jgi:hypothetical protein